MEGNTIVLLMRPYLALHNRPVILFRREAKFSSQKVAKTCLRSLALVNGPSLALVSDIIHAHVAVSNSQTRTYSGEGHPFRPCLPWNKQKPAVHTITIVLHDQ